MDDKLDSIGDSSRLDKEEHQILDRIKIHYSKKLSRLVSDKEAIEIADNLLTFGKAIHGLE